MGYQAVYLVENGYREDPYRFVNSGTDGEVCFEAWDGTRVRRYFADALYLYRRRPEERSAQEILFYAGVPVVLLITDSRVVLRVPHHQESRHRDETMAAVLQETQVPDRGRSMTLMGMVRYEWLSQISYQRKVSRSTEECVRLYYKDLSGAKWHLDLVFANEADAEFLANEILHRACRYRLEMRDDKNDKELYFFNHYLSRYEIDPAEDPRHYMASIRFPTQYPAPGGYDVRPDLHGQ